MTYSLYKIVVCKAPFGMLVDILLDLDFNLNDFYSKTDEELAVLAVTDKLAAEILIMRYWKLILIKSKIYANSNTESDDLHQEGLMGLFKAITSFNPGKGVKFSTFSEVCIVNRMRNFLVKSGKRKDVDWLDSLDESETPSVEETPESIYLYKESVAELRKNIRNSLSETELEIFNLCCVEGFSYRSTAEKLGIKEKSVDNAVQRARKKIRALLKESN